MTFQSQPQQIVEADASSVQTRVVKKGLCQDKEVFWNSYYLNPAIQWLKILNNCY
jgi:hypothetical protein